MSDDSGRILIADDEPALLKMMSFYLKRLGFDVTTALTTEEARREFEAAPASFAGAVLDASMSGLKMEDLALQILRDNPTVFVIAASGYPLDMAAFEPAAPGRVMFLHKPFTPEMLAGAVRRMIAAQKEEL